MKKNMYKQPKTEVVELLTERMMQDLTISINSGTDPNPAAGMPRRGAGIPD